MHDIYETLQQTEMWYGQDDFPYRIEEMEQSHRINVKNFLERRAQHLFSRGVWREFQEIRNAPEEVQRAWSYENRNVLTGDPVDWLNNRPFMKALEQAIKNHATIDGEVVDSHLVDEKDLGTLASACKRQYGRYVDKTTGEITRDAGTITMADAKQSVRDGVYRMKRSATGRLVFSAPPLQGVSSRLLEAVPEPEVFECFVGHSDGDTEEKCTENRYQDWKNSHDTTECGGMQNGCQLCAHIW